MPEPTRLQIRAQDVVLAADEYGGSGAPPVVLLHGGGQTRHSWTVTARDLSERGWRSVAVDLRGHGESGWSADGRYSLDRFADDVLAIIEFVGRPPVLVGASLGGNAALEAVGNHPTSAIGLVLVDVSPFLQPAGTQRIREFMTGRPEGFATLEEVADAVSSYLPHRPRPTSLEGLRKNLRQVEGRYFWHWDPAFMNRPSDGAVQRDRLVDPARLGAAAASLRIPTLLIRGGESDVLSEDDARRFVELVPHAEYYHVAGAHHMVVGDDNRTFDAILAEFLDRRIRSRLDLFGQFGDHCA